MTSNDRRHVPPAFEDLDVWFEEMDDVWYLCATSDSWHTIKVPLAQLQLELHRFTNTVLPDLAMLKELQTADSSITMLDIENYDRVRTAAREERRVG